jgi:dTMP kinase
MIISFEGIDGCGKSTQEKILAEWLGRNGSTVHRVREPGGTDLSEKVRNLLLDRSRDIDPFAEMLLFSAARAQLCRTRIQKWHDNGEMILCDRFFDSTVAYQGGGRGVAEPEWLESFQHMVTGGLIPDRTYYFRIDQKTARSRMNNRSGVEEDRMEASGHEFFGRVISAYEELAEANPNRILILDATLGIEELAITIRADIEQFLKTDRNTKSVSR